METGMARIKEASARAIHRRASSTARKRGYGEKRTNAYVYGAKRRAGWKPRGER